MTLVLVLYVNSVNASKVNTKQSIFMDNDKNLLTTTLLTIYTRQDNYHSIYWWWCRLIIMSKYVYWNGSFLYNTISDLYNIRLNTLLFLTGKSSIQKIVNSRQFNFFLSIFFFFSAPNFFSCMKFFMRKPLF